MEDINNNWGYLRENREAAKKAGKDSETGLCRTGLEDYLKVIFPNTSDWIHDKQLGNINGKNYRQRPDYRSESLKLIVEFDGLPHYKDPEIILKDEENNHLFNSLGYKVVRIPYFIQLTQETVRILFGVEVDIPLFDETIPSLGISGKNTPAFLCPLGLQRMAKEFIKFPSQLKVNFDYLKSIALAGPKETLLCGIDLLENQISLIRHEEEENRSPMSIR